MKRWIALLMCVSMLCLCAAAVSPEQRARDVYQALAEERFGDVCALLDDTMAAQLNADALKQGLDSVVAMAGALDAVESVETDASGVIVLTATHERGSVVMKVVFDTAGRISGLGLSPVVAASESSASLPDGAQAVAVTLFAGTNMALNGEIVLPQGADESTAWVVFAHGSGASDMDETVGALRPFRDLAYGLAAEGVASLRFDKITYAYPEGAYDTVEAEYLTPTAEAVRLLREALGAGRVYLLGHSEGGMLAPWLVSQCGLDGGIVLAGTPRPLWEMSYEQNLAMIATMPEDARPALLEQVEAERERALAIDAGALEDARGQTPFGMDAYYIRHMDGLDQVALAKGSGKPFLFLWGEADFQVSEQAFRAWEDGLGESESYRYITYPGLNHLFMAAQEGDGIANAMQVYSREGSVDDAVIRDIAGWLEGLER